ncbi:MAG: 4-hydroxy-tetrahydrodipicolinate reductase [Opitutae bacterium]|nr:4-hydroxy-tetrahydrodipicolinate reductase [Opitutae bacterium]
MNTAINILLIGAKGRMGQAIIECASAQNAKIIGACDVNDDPSEFISDCDVIIDFSFYQTTLDIAALAVKHNKGLVIGTTGHDADTKTKIIDTISGKIPVVWAGNYSIGVNTLNYLTKKASKLLHEQFEAEVLEMHHHDKKDAPSGTAERLIEILKDQYNLNSDQCVHGREGQVGARPKQEIGVHALRGGDIVGEHTVFFCGDGERVELTHKATDRKIFAKGALFAAHWTKTASNGLFNMEDVLGISE